MKKLVFAVAAAASAGLSLSTSAEEITVSSVAELRAAIANKTDVPNGSTIVLKASETPYDVSADGLGAIKISRELTLKGETDNPRDTVLSGGGVINVLEVSGSNSLVTGLTVTNGLAQMTDNRKWYSGGGILMNGETTVVSNCVVTGCHFDTRTDYLEGTVVADMTKVYGAGVHARSGSLLTHTLVENCVIYNDKKAKAVANGAGISVGGLQGTVPARAVDCEVRGCLTQTLTSGGGTSVLAGGGMSVGENGYADHCTIHGNVIRASDEAPSRGYGGGLLILGGSVVSNSLVYCNTNWVSGMCGGGVSIESSGLLCSSTVSNNYSVSNGGGVFHVNQPTGGMRDCLIVGNRADANGGGGYGGMAAKGCVFRGNVAKTQSGAWEVTNASGWFSNCVFEANSTEAKYGEAKSLYVMRATTAPAIIEGCWFVNHEITDSKSVVLMGGNSPTAAEYRGRVRNCVFANNPGGTALNVNYPEYGPVIDNCTFAGVDTWNYAIPAATSKRETKIIVRNSLFTGWKNGGLAPNLALEMPDSVSNNYDMVSTTLPKDADGKVTNGNLSGKDVGEPCFADAANLNLTLTKNSPLIGKGLVLDWMTNEDGTPNAAARDAGCGTYAIEKVGDYGIRVNFGRKFHPRYAGGEDRPDIGAYEYAPVFGLLLMVK